MSEEISAYFQVVNLRYFKLVLESNEYIFFSFFKLNKVSCQTDFFGEEMKDFKGLPRGKEEEDFLRLKSQD